MFEGSVINSLMSGTIGQPEPEPGMGATELMWSDRYPYTIVSVERYKSGARKGLVRSLVARRDAVTADRSKGEPAMGHQNWVITPDPRGVERTFTRRKDDAFRAEGGGTQLRIGERDHYHDWSF